MRKETVELDEVRAAGLRRAIEENPQMVGMLGALGDRRIVGIVVEGPEAEAPGPEASARKPRK